MLVVEMNFGPPNDITKLNLCPLWHHKDYTRMLNGVFLKLCWWEMLSHFDLYGLSFMHRLTWTLIRAFDSLTHSPAAFSTSVILFSALTFISPKLCKIIYFFVQSQYVWCIFARCTAGTTTWPKSHRAGGTAVRSDLDQETFSSRWQKTSEAVWHH